MKLIAFLGTTPYDEVETPQGASLIQSLATAGTVGSLLNLLPEQRPHLLTENRRQLLNRGLRRDIAERLYLVDNHVAHTRLHAQLHSRIALLYPQFAQLLCSFRYPLAPPHIHLLCLHHLYLHYDYTMPMTKKSSPPSDCPPQSGIMIDRQEVKRPHQMGRNPL